MTTVIKPFETYQYHEVLYNVQRHSGTLQKEKNLLELIRNLGQEMTHRAN